MSIHFGPSMALIKYPRRKRLCIRAQTRGPLNLRAYWRSDCTMTAVKNQDVEIAQHNDVSVFIDMLNDSGDPLDVSGFISLEWVVAQSVRGSILISKTLASGDLVLPSAFLATASLSRAETGALPAKTLYHEFRGINSSNEAQTMVAGKFKVIDTRIGDA